jgi:hypothetical protein
MFDNCSCGLLLRKLVCPAHLYKVQCFPLVFTTLNEVGFDYEKITQPE